MSPLPDPDHCYRAVQSRDARFDGWFYTAVTSTGIYCRPSCPAVTPQRRNVRFYATAAAAQQAGFRACLRCRPDAAPGSPDWNLRADLVGRAMRLIADGVIEREGVGGLSRRLGYSERHVHRQLATELGAGPLAIARAQRGQTARILIETTDLPFAEIAFASGFASVRQFNDTVRAVFATTPSGLRQRRSRGIPIGGGAVTVRLPYRTPFTGPWDFLATRAIAGVECSGDGYTRALRLAHGLGTVTLSPGDGHVTCTLRLDDLRDLASAVQRCRRIFDLDADPQAVDALLGADPFLAALVAKVPGMRLPGSADAGEMAARAIVGQQVSVAAARTVLGRIAAAHGTELRAGDGEVTRAFPAAAALAEATDLPMPQARAATLRAVSTAIATGAIDLDPGADPEEAHRGLLAIPGIGPWTAGYLTMRALGLPDVLLDTDLAVRRGATALGITDLTAHAERWRPWRSYAVLHLWQASTLEG
ncbi:MAG: AraC family transcriptional regulator [Cryptosporangiaceae bacterium]|nr:AraC family transcriptional regulator [Cryptosporangiaceae bacterium]